MSKFEVNLNREIEKFIANGSDIIDAVCHWCEQNNVDVETAAALIKKDAILRARVQVEAENLNILPQTAKLPI